MQGQKPPTVRQSNRLATIKGLWCIPCAMDAWGHVTTVQHVVEGKYRVGHDCTYGACGWHHLGYPPDGLTISEAAAAWGPSLQHDLRGYEKRYGPERVLVAIQDVVLERVEALRQSNEFMGENDFLQLVQQEAYNQLGRSPASVGR